MRPPTRRSNTVSAMSTPSMLCSRGLMRSNCSVNTRNARSTGASTTICVRTDVSCALAVMRPPLWFWLFGGLLVGRQGFAPEPVELSAKGAHAVRVELVDAPIACGPVDDQPRILQHLQVLGNRRASDRQLRCELAHGSGAVGKALENGAPRRVR